MSLKRWGILGVALVCGCSSRPTGDDVFTTADLDTGLDPETSGGDTDTDTDASEPAPDSDTALTTPTPPGAESSTGPGEPECGNGVVDQNERCDGENLDGMSCVDFDFEEGELLCGNTCKGFNSAGCFTCGNGDLEGPEGCDGSLPKSVTCESQGLTAGTVVCSTKTCELDLSGCSLCGDDEATIDEPCDGVDLRGETCASIGFKGGDLGCRADECRFDVSACEGGMFSEDWESGDIAMPPWVLGGNANWTASGSNPIAGSFSAQAGAIDHSQTSSLEVDMTFPSGGTIDFTHEESSESGFDFLQFFIDGTMEDEWSGTNAAAMESYPVDAGEHTFEWRYSKDGSVDTAQDTVWIDDIATNGGGPI